MLDSIRPLTDVPPSDDARVAGADIAAARQRRALQQQAQRRARECIDQAHADAQAIRARAFEEGYAEGVLRAATDLASRMLEAQVFGAQLRDDLARAARQLLGELLRSDQWLDEMLERWLTHQRADAGAVLQVLLPLRCKSRGNELRQRLQVHWPGSLVFDYQPQERYVLRLADQLLEFDIEANCQRFEPQLLARLTGLPPSVRALDQASRQLLIDLCSTFGEPAVPVRDED
jgi:hypothetical protein